MHIKWNRNLDGSRPSNQVGVVVVGDVADAEENGSLDGGGGERPEIVVGDLMVCQQSSRDTLKSKTILANNLSTPKLEVPLLPPTRAETDTNNNSNSSSSSATMLMSKSTPSSLSSNSSSSLSRRHLPSKNTTTTTAAAAALLVTPTNKLTSKGALTTLISLFRFRDDHNDLMVRGNSGLGGGGGGGGAGSRSLSGRSLLRRRNHHSLERLNHLARENFYGTPAALEGKQTGERRRYSSMAALEARKSSLGTPTKSETKSDSVQSSSKCDSKTSTTTTTASTGQTSRPSNTPTVTTRNPRSTASTPIISTTAVMLETPRKALVKFVNDEPASPECLAFWNEQNGSNPINVPSSSTDHSPLPSADNLKSILRVRLASGDVGSGDGLGSRASSTLSSTTTSSSLSSSSSSSSSSHSGSGALAKRVRFARPMATYSLIVVGEN